MNGPEIVTDFVSNDGELIGNEDGDGGATHGV